MRFTIAVGILTGIAAFGAVTAVDQAAQPSHATGSIQLPAVKGNWHIGCDSDNYCSYYQGNGASSGADGPLSARAYLDCNKCGQGISCKGSYCEFQCHGCDHYICRDGEMSDLCLDVPQELADMLATQTVTSISTATPTALPSTVTVVPFTRTVMVPVPQDSTTTDPPSATTVWVDPLPESETTVWVDPTSTSEPTVYTITVLPKSQFELARRNEPAATAIASPMPVRRNVAFTQPQCQPCGPITCPVCYDDCPSCPHYMCSDLANHLTVCMNLHAEWEPPTFDISASGSGPETTTVVAMPPIRTETVTQTVWNLPQTIVSAVSAPTTQTITIYPPVVSQTTMYSPYVAAVTMAPPKTVVPVTRVYVSTLPQVSTVYVNPPVGSTSTVYVDSPVGSTSTVYVDPTSTSTVYVDPPSTSTVYVDPPSTSTVYVVPQPPQVSTVIVAPPQISTVTVPLPSASTSTVFVYPMPVPSIPASSRTVIEIPMTQTLTRTLARQARATAAPLSRRSAFTEAMCLPCEGNPDCDGCDFACDTCEHFLCKDSSFGTYICVDFDPVQRTIETRDADKASNQTLGQAASLLVRDGGGYVIPLRPSPQGKNANDYEAEHTIGLQPPVSDGPAPYFEFNDADCLECGEGDDCTDCDWQFKCGMKKKCFYNGARNVVQLCYELGQKCHV